MTQAPGPKTIGIQVGAVSFVDEGVEQTLEVNTIFLTIKQTRAPDHGGVDIVAAVQPARRRFGIGA